MHSIDNMLIDWLINYHGNRFNRISFILSMLIFLSKKPKNINNQAKKIMRAENYEHHLPWNDKPVSLLNLLLKHYSN